MNILFVLYDSFETNTANPLILYTRELKKLGHECVITVPNNLKSYRSHDSSSFKPTLYDEVLSHPKSVFSNQCAADILHVCTPRETTRHFVIAYQSKLPTPYIVYLEDNELWISKRILNLSADELTQKSSLQISKILPKTLSHPFFYKDFIALADAVVVIQEKLKTDVPPTVYCETIMIGVDLTFFSPRKNNNTLREKFGINKQEKLIVYHGGLNSCTRPAIKSLCKAIQLINEQGLPCKLIRTGPFKIDFFDEMSKQVKNVVIDLGVLPREQLPDLLALADVLVQPGKIDQFEDLRLPGKIPEFLAMGIPVIFPNVNISHLFQNEKNAIFLEKGTAKEIAEKCIKIFNCPDNAKVIGKNGRLIAEQLFDVRNQALLLEKLYQKVCNKFDKSLAKKIWQVNDPSKCLSSFFSRKLRLIAENTNMLECDDINKILKMYADHIDSTQSQLRGFEFEIEELESKIDKLESKLDNAMRETVEVQKQKNDYERSILSSFSWRITKPLRFLSHHIKKFLKRKDKNSIDSQKNSFKYNR